MNVHGAFENSENLDVSPDEDFISSGRLVIYLQTNRVIETPMKIQEIKMSFSQTI